MSVSVCVCVCVCVFVCVRVCLCVCLCYIDDINFIFVGLGRLFFLLVFFLTELKCFLFQRFSLSTQQLMGTQFKSGNV